MAQIIKKQFIQHVEISEEPNTIDSVTNQEAIALQTAAYEQGYKVGQNEAHKSIEQSFEATKEQLACLLNTIPHALQQARIELQAELAPLCLILMQQYFAHQVVDTLILEQQINQLLHELNQQQNIEIYLHPKDIQALHEGKIQLSSGSAITIKTDAALNLGGFIIKTNHGTFDASLEKQITNLKNYLYQLKNEESL